MGNTSPSLGHLQLAIPTPVPQSSTCMLLSKKGVFYVTNSSTCALYIIQHGEVVTLIELEGCPTRMCFSNEEQNILVCVDETVHEYTHTGKHIRTIDTGCIVGAVAWNSIHNLMAVGRADVDTGASVDMDGRIKLYNYTDANFVTAFCNYGQDATCMRVLTSLMFTNDSCFLVAAETRAYSSLVVFNLKGDFIKSISVPGLLGGCVDFILPVDDKIILIDKNSHSLLTLRKKGVGSGSGSGSNKQSFFTATKMNLKNVHFFSPISICKDSKCVFILNGDTGILDVIPRKNIGM